MDELHSELHDIDPFNETIISLKKHFSQKSFQEKRAHFWEAFFEKFNTDTDLNSDDDSDCKSGTRPNLRSNKKAETDSEDSEEEEYHPKKRKGPSDQSNYARPKRKALKSNTVVKGKNKKSGKTKKNNLTPAAKVHSSIENKENESMDTSSSLEDDNELRIVHIVENQLRSDIRDKLYKRYCAQIQNNEKDFIYWTNLVKEEMMKLSEIISVEDIQWYIKSALLRVIGGKENSSVQPG